MIGQQDTVTHPHTGRVGERASGNKRSFGSTAADSSLGRFCLCREAVVDRSDARFENDSAFYILPIPPMERTSHTATFHPPLKTGPSLVMNIPNLANNPAVNLICPGFGGSNSIEAILRQELELILSPTASGPEGGIELLRMFSSRLRMFSSRGLNRRVRH